MSSLEVNVLSKRELLDIESVCDQYEADQKSSTVSLDIQLYVKRVNISIQPIVRAELERIQAEWGIDSGTERIADSTRGKRVIGRVPTRVPSQSYLQSKLGKRFQLFDLLGQGSSGCVWKAFDQQLNRLVAIKLPHADVPSHTDHFVREARAASRLNHPNIATILEVGQENDHCFLLTELVEGGSLAERLLAGQLTIPESVNLLIEVAKAIEYAHAMGIVHRDLKPHNILLADDGSVKLVDFGLAKDSNDLDVTLTQTGTLIGTPAYMSPEQADSSQCKPQATTDIYSFGVVFFQLLTGDVPFRGNPQIVLFQLLHADPPAPIRLDPNLPVELNTLCLKCLEKNPADRIQTAKELREELERFRDGHPIRCKPASFAFIAKKWIGRNQWLATWIASTCLLLIAVTGISVFSAIEIARSRDKVQEAAANAETVLRVFKSHLQSSDLFSAIRSGGAKVRAGNPIEAADLKSLAEQSRMELASAPVVLASVIDEVANLHRSIGEFPAARSLLDESKRMRENIVKSKPGITIPIKDQMVSLFYEGWWEQDQSNWKAAEPYYRRVLAEMPKDETRENQLFRSDVLFQMGQLKIDAGNATEGKDFMQKSLEIRQRFLPESSPAIKSSKLGLMLSDCDRMDQFPFDKLLNLFEGNDWVNSMALEYTNCFLNRTMKNYPQAAISYERVLARLREEFPANHPISLFALGDYAGFLVESGDYRKANIVANELFEVADRICPHHQKLIAAKLDYAFELMNAKNFQRASKFYQECLAQQEKTDKFPEQANYGLAWCSIMRNDSENALKHAEALWGHRKNKTASQVAWCAFTYARALELAGRLETSKEMDQRALQEAVIQLHFPKNDPIALERLSKIHVHNGEFAKAEELLRDAVSLERGNRPRNHPRIADRLTSLANVLVKQNRIAEARTILKEVLEIQKTSLPDYDLRIEENTLELKRLEAL